MLSIRLWPGDVQNIQRGLVPRIYGRSYAIEAEITVPEGGAEGVLVANADFIGQPYRNPGPNLPHIA